MGGGRAGSALTVRVGFAVMALAALGSGYIGLHRYLADRPRFGTAVLDLAYWDVQLFVLGSTPLAGGGPLPWELQFARFAAPAATAYALFTSAHALFNDQITLARARRARGHTVVCGTTPAMTFLARRLAEESGGAPWHRLPRVVVIDPGPAAVDAADLRLPPGTVRVVGDPRDGEVLRRAGVPRAREVMALTPDSVFNAEVALAVRAIEGGDGDGVCYAEVDDHDVCAEMAARVLSVQGRSRMRVEFFSRDDRSARRLLDRHPVPDGAEGGAAGGTGPAVLVVGSGALTRALVTEMARRRGHGGPPSRALPVRVVDDHEGVGRLASRLSLPPGALRLTTATLDLWSVRAASELAVDGPGGPRLPTHVYVCLDDEMAGIRAGLSAGRLLPGRAVRIVVAATRSAVFGRVLDDGDEPSPGRPRPVTLHNIVETVYTPEAVRQGDIEDIARAAHGAYVEASRRRGDTPATNPSMVAWDDLPARLRDDNRAQAADIGRKLAAIGAAVVPDRDGDDPFAFDDAEVEQLARMEHDRWVRRRLDAGWVHDAERDDARKRHPDLVAWSELTAQGRDKDRSAIREIPAQLRSAGYSIVRGSP